MVDALDRKLAQRRYADSCAGMQTLGRIVKTLKSESESAATILVEELAGLGFVCAASQ